MADPAKITLSALGLQSRGGHDVPVTGLSVDSREVRPGHLFGALPGTNIHGAEFITFALRMGASAILTDRAGAEIARDELAGSAAAVVVTEDPRQALACAAALFFGRQPGTVVAVTGTSGKTSVVNFTRQIWEGLGRKACSIGTMGVQGAWQAPLTHTTPEPIALHRALAEMAAHGVTHAAMEASSHGLAQRRLDGVAIKAAAFTNFSQDHLDYHKDFDDYFNAKVGLFDRILPEDGVAVVNTDDPRGVQMLGHARARTRGLLTIGRGQDCDLRILAQAYDATGQTLRFAWQGAPHQTRLELIGGFQAENVLAAAGLAIGAGEIPERVFPVLSELETVRGRMELAATRGNGAAVFVDYSHKPGALVSALRSLRPHVMGRIVVVFGAGGDRDRGKRPLMGQAAAKNADLVIVTDDNPRTEDAATIRAEVMAGCPEATEVGDRAEAILRGVDALEAGDALLIAGKGHETGQIVGENVYPFDDVEQASVAVAALDGAVS
ncbi:UDP-N-acetylmuramoylalanyl-D-glutamate--2,6-diaminopimelate ligase [Rhodovulum imhoffii]|uniref:UDP-N-acetylmuramoyl-L-alanyl-D-glutamate--2,6-diaminopimelate ligase n=1 Tax=Rhodovulum imhoffii TaxID=365340 RepID=A0A2T5BPQ7_9RHOB|nr:UDP-N-acetylmuramoyl-L-alanyl-D-glutamate--2,6-diaminopimelate ligase [Rhodovulum imhoffii]MBK5932882.1 UDP-N-acetylmuramoyl-L-alanyl-D-glutamate--2,6-diaminopimelate ligase [Rhodovulum imhoffii]PTN00962.1 UDP-N-acetylmuramoylalanyl-D-glutamate--2,6-diaminopimelate ligase [Rhodovulum imhoffii]